jgi:AraC-like DNA-binding protein
VTHIDRGSIAYYRLEDGSVEIVQMADSSCSFREHNHVSRYTIGLVRSGSLRLRRKENTLLCRQGESFVIPPYEPHSILKEEDPYSLLSICIRTEYIVKHSLEDVKDRIEALLETMPAEHRLSESERLQLSEATERIPLLLQDTPYEDLSLSGIRDRIILEPEQDFRVDELSQNIYRSKYHMIRSFKKAVGLTPHRFQVQLRIRRAKELLLSPSFVSIAEVASATGFCDQSHFIHSFKTVVGMTPTDYIRAQHGDG